MFSIEVKNRDGAGLGPSPKVSSEFYVRTDGIEKMSSNCLDHIRRKGVRNVDLFKEIRLHKIGAFGLLSKQ